MSLQPRCRFCSAPLSGSFADRGMSPLSNSFLAPEQLNRMERFYPLHAWVCEACLLEQLEQFETPENIFSDYAYSSAYSCAWLEHALRHALDSIERFGLQSSALVVEFASNDGYLLQYFAQGGI